MANDPIDSFATDAADADKSGPPSQIIDAGYLEGDIPTHQAVNGLWARRLLHYLDGYDAAGTMKKGQVAVICSHKNDFGSGEATDQYYSGGDTAVKATGQYVVTQDTTGTEIYVLKRSDLSLHRTITTGTTGTIGCVDGANVYFTDGANIICWAIESGVQQWTQAVAYSPRQSDGTRLYCSSGNNVYALDCGTGATTWGAYNHNGTVRQLYGNGRQLFLVGAASGHGSGATMRCIEAATGKDDAGEGGIGTSTEDWTWDAVPGGLTVAAASFLAYNGDVLYVNGDVSGTYEILGINPFDGAVVHTTTRTTPIGDMAITKDHLYVLDTGDDRVDVYPLDLSHRLWRHVPGAGATTLDAMCVDAESLFLVENPTAGQRVTKHNLAGRPSAVMVYRRGAGEDNFWPWPHLLLHPLL